MIKSQIRLGTKKLKGYAETHCRRCAAGWTRQGKEGGVLTVCLLDREPVLGDMTHCDRFEVKEQQ